MTTSMKGDENRFQRLKEEAAGYLLARADIPTGLDRSEAYARSRSRLLELFGATEADWGDWRWHMSHRVRDLSHLESVLELSLRQREEIIRISERVRWSISPHFAALLDPRDERDPLRLQSIPSLAEITDTQGLPDPAAEEETSPCPLVVRRYPDRLIIKATDCCAMYCRHCQRRRLVGLRDHAATRQELEAALQYVAANPEIRDVLITGGDPLTMGDKDLDWLLGQLDSIPHVEIKRIGTRLPVTLPQRITANLCRVLKRHPPVYLNTQFNHPLEVTEEAIRACNMLADAGVVIGNQAVLLKGVNDDSYVIRRLFHELLKIRVRPYYLFQARPVRGTSHFITTIDKGLEIMDDLRGRTSGLAIPSYVVNISDGLGKVPLLPQYVVSRTNDTFVLRTWENRLVEVPNGPPLDREEQKG